MVVVVQSFHCDAMIMKIPAIIPYEFGKPRCFNDLSGRSIHEIWPTHHVMDQRHGQPAAMLAHMEHDSIESMSPLQTDELRYSNSLHVPSLEHSYANISFKESTKAE